MCSEAVAPVVVACERDQARIEIRQIFVIPPSPGERRLVVVVEALVVTEPRVVDGPGGPPEDLGLCGRSSANEFGSASTRSNVPRPQLMSQDRK
jgi:hypothetical protein